MLLTSKKTLMVENRSYQTASPCVPYTIAHSTNMSLESVPTTSFKCAAMF